MPNDHACRRFSRPLTRRQMLTQSASGFGMLALQTLLAEQAHAENPLAPKKPMFPAKAKRVIFIFLHGGPSQVDTFDPKPMLTKYHGKPAPAGNLRTERKTGALLSSNEFVFY